MWYSPHRGISVVARDASPVVRGHDLTGCRQNCVSQSPDARHRITRSGSIVKRCSAVRATVVPSSPQACSSQGGDPVGDQVRRPSACGSTPGAGRRELQLRVGVGPPDRGARRDRCVATRRPCNRRAHHRGQTVSARHSIRRRERRAQSAPRRGPRLLRGDWQLPVAASRLGGQPCSAPSVETRSTKSQSAACRGDLRRAANREARHASSRTRRPSGPWSRRTQRDDRSPPAAPRAGQPTETTAGRRAASRPEASAGGRNPRSVKQLDRVLERLLAEVEGVIVGKASRADVHRREGVNGDGRARGRRTACARSASSVVRGRRCSTRDCRSPDPATPPAPVAREPTGPPAARGGVLRRPSGRASHRRAGRSRRYRTPTRRLARAGDGTAR